MTSSIHSAAAGRAIYKSSRLLPCGCRVHGTGSNPSPYIDCDEAARLRKEAERACRLNHPNGMEAIEAWRAHRAQTPVYLGGK